MIICLFLASLLRRRPGTSEDLLPVVTLVAVLEYSVNIIKWRKEGSILTRRAMLLALVDAFLGDDSGGRLYAFTIDGVVLYNSTSATDLATTKTMTVDVPQRTHRSLPVRRSCIPRTV